MHRFKVISVNLKGYKLLF